LFAINLNTTKYCWPARSLDWWRYIFRQF